MARHRPSGQQEVVPEDVVVYAAGPSPTPTAPMQAVATSPTISIMKLTVPLPILASMLLVGCTLVVSIALTWFRLVSHAEAADLHLDKFALIQGGGLAYRVDVSQLRNDFEKRIRKTLKGMAINCRQTGDRMTCSVDLTEEP